MAKRSPRIPAARIRKQHFHHAFLQFSLDRVATTFQPVKGLEPFHLPAEPAHVSTILDVFDDDVDIDISQLWYDTFKDSILRFTWDSGGPGGGSRWDLDALTLDSKRRLYVVTPSDDEGPEIIASTPPVCNYDEADMRLVELLKTNGTEFGVWLPRE